MNKLKEMRFIEIEKMIASNKNVYVTDLAKYFHVTPETIRRDLGELEKKKRVSRFHGGATFYKKIEKEPMFNQKLNTNKMDKKNIAKEAVRRIQNGDIIAVDVGSTTIHLASYISGEDLTIITNSLAAADAFSLALERKQFTGQVLLLGGKLNPTQRSVSGAMTLRWLENFHFNKSFISCGGLVEAGIYDYDLDECLVSQKMIENSKESILLVDDSKIMDTSLVKICHVEQVHEIISNGSCPWKKIQHMWTKVGD